MAKKIARKQPKTFHYEDMEQRLLFSADVMPGLDGMAADESVLVQDVTHQDQIQCDTDPETVEQTAREGRWELVFVTENVAE